MDSNFCQSCNTSPLSYKAIHFQKSSIGSTAYTRPGQMSMPFKYLTQLQLAGEPGIQSFHSKVLCKNQIKRLHQRWYEKDPKNR